MDHDHEKEKITFCFSRSKILTTVSMPPVATNLSFPSIAKHVIPFILVECMGNDSQSLKFEIYYRKNKPKRTLRHKSYLIGWIFIEKVLIFSHLLPDLNEFHLLLLDFLNKGLREASFSF